MKALPEKHQNTVKPQLWHFLYCLGGFSTSKLTRNFSEKLKNALKSQITCQFDDFLVSDSIFNANPHFRSYELEKIFGIEIFVYQLPKKYIKNIWKIGGKINLHYSPLLVSLLLSKKTFLSREFLHHHHHNAPDDLFFL